MRPSKKIQLTSTEEKQTVEPRNFSVEELANGCRVSGVCPDGNEISCESDMRSGCSFDSGIMSITCLSQSSKRETIICSGSDSGSGSGANDPVKACEGLNEGAPCSWHNGTSEQRGKCKTVGNRTYCVSGAKKKL